MNFSPLKKYLFITFSLAWIIQIFAAIVIQHSAGTILFPLCLILCMYMPMLGVFFTKKSLRGFGWKIQRKKLPILLAAWLIPIFLTLLGSILYYIIFPTHFDGSGQSIFSQYSLPAEQKLTLSRNWNSVLFSQILSSIFLAPFINTFTALGEEVGWRGFLYPLLKEKYGYIKGILLGGAIWGCWHWPIMILAGYNYGTNYAGAPILGPIVFCIFTIAVGAFLDNLYQNSASIWTCALGHGCFNAIGGIGSLFYNPTFSSYKILGPMPIGLISGIPFLILAIILVKRKTTFHP